MSENGYRVAPPGFTPTQREFFDREGYLVLEDALSEEEVGRYLEAIDRCIADDPKFAPDKFYARENIVELDRVFTALIDHPRHVGFVYDFYGELLKLHISQFFIRPHGGTYNLWHPDGARAVPYGVFAPHLPLQIKIGLWLTDLPQPKMGNIVIRPRSQHEQYFEHYDTSNSVPDEKVLCLRRGTMTLLNCNVWHRVEPNESDVVRKNIFLAYCPSWVVAADHFHSNAEWLQTLNREQRIIMRNYSYAYDHTKPPKEDFPLFLDRDTSLDHDPGLYGEHVAMHRRKRKVTHEKMS
ncbi:MAG: phytanoyl-CoA dioxygenase family protein [Abitibacteriaceae bacterium]|nr:phytanoyl-CoA dioxygenase family protein [Abditibacteriaceae bacterium]MBV9866182.1 phytanoyl-CoA dioxygenase family protein [Abditibacteriaceae bacterium]